MNHLALCLSFGLLVGCAAAPVGENDFATAPTDGGGGVDAAGCRPACTGATHCNASGHCVACLDDTHCAAGSYCKVVSPLISICTPGCMSDDRCAPMQKCCSGQCVDPNVDPRHCGGCGMACAAVHAGVSCAGGRCQTGTCDPGW